MKNILVKSRLPQVWSKAFFTDDLLKKIMKNAGIVLMGNTGASLLNFVSFTIVVKSLGAELFAFFVLTQTYVLILNGIFNIQTWESMVKFGSSYLKKEGLKNIVQSNFIMDLLSALFAFVIGILMVQSVVGILSWDDRIAKTISLYCLTVPFNLVSFTIGIPRLFKKFGVLAKVQVLSASLKLILVVSATVLGPTLFTFVGIYLIVDIIRNLFLISFSFWLLKVNDLGGWWREKFKVNWEQLRFIWWTNLRSIVRIPVQYCDVVIISMVMSLEMVGVYKVYKEIAGLLNRLGGPVNQTIFPEYSKLIGESQSEQAVKLTKKVIVVMMLCSLFIGVVLMVLSKVFLGKVYGLEFLPSISGLYLLIFLYAISFFTIPINSLFVAAGFAKMGFYVVVFTNGLYLVIGYVFGGLFGLYGIITAYGTQLFLNKGLKIYLLRRHRYGWNEIIR